MKLLFSFKGMIGRGKFIGLTILYMLTVLLIIGLTPESVGMVSALIYLFINLTLGVKRLRDINYSPWLILLYLVPVAGIVLFIMLMFIKGKNGNMTTIKNTKTNVNVDKEVNDQPVASLKEIQKNVFRILEDSIG